MIVFPYKGTVKVSLKGLRALPNKCSLTEPLVSFLVTSALGVFDVRAKKDVFAGFLARQVRESELGGPGTELLEPLRGFFELEQHVQFQLRTRSEVARVVVANDSHWTDLRVVERVRLSALLQQAAGTGAGAGTGGTAGAGGIICATWAAHEREHGQSQEQGQGQGHGAGGEGDDLLKVWQGALFLKDSPNIRVYFLSAHDMVRTHARPSHNAGMAWHGMA